MRALAVIGANYGDEGKGLVTDYLSALTAADVVVRFNGGAQAGHTVVMPDGRRHVFHHLGAGMFAGAATFLSRFFLVNPILFNQEHDVLRAPFRPDPIVMVDPLTPVTTIYDVLINQLIETARGDDRHGSCGVGIGETVERHGHPGFQLFAGDLGHPNTVSVKLMHIAQEWIPRRLEQLEVKPSEQFKRIVDAAETINKFIREAELFTARVAITSQRVLEKAATVVFEGAQGLGLHQDDQDEFPHVTRSRTGTDNVLAMLSELGVKDLEAYYVTRAYLTRHGAGKLSGELKRKPYPAIVDETNIPNSFQGALRFAFFDPAQTAKRIARDLARPTSVKVDPKLVVTCLDQLKGRLCVDLGSRVKCFEKTGVIGVSGEEHAEEIYGLVSSTGGIAFSGALWSNGPTRNDVHRIYR